MYDKPFIISGPLSNNAFSFNRRKSTQIYVPSLIIGDLDDLEEGDKTAFEEFNENDELQSCRGIKNFIQTEILGIPTYIFDNHNHAFAFWCKAYIQNQITPDAVLIHIDQHKDSRLPEEFIKASDLKDGKKVMQYTNSVLNVGNFISPAQKTGLIGTVLNLDSESAFINPPSIPSGKSVILDIDLDIFAQTMDYIKDEIKINRITELIKKADLITIATSPYFISQKTAIRYLKQISALATGRGSGGA